MNDDPQTSKNSSLNRRLAGIVVLLAIINLCIYGYRSRCESQAKKLSELSIGMKLGKGEPLGELKQLREQVLTNYRRECTHIRRLSSMSLLTDDTVEDFPISTGKSIAAFTFRPKSANATRGQPVGHDESVRLIAYIPPGNHRLCYSFREVFGREYAERNTSRGRKDTAAKRAAWDANTVVVDVPTGAVHEIVFSVHPTGKEPGLHVSVTGHHKAIHPLRKTKPVYHSYRYFCRKFLPNQTMGPIDEFQDSVWQRNLTNDTDIMFYEITMASETEREAYWTGKLSSQRGKREGLYLRAWIDSDEKSSASAMFMSFHIKRFLQRHGPDSERWKAPDMSYVMGMFGDLISQQPLPDLSQFVTPIDDSGRLYFR